MVIFILWRKVQSWWRHPEWRESRIDFPCSVSGRARLVSLELSVRLDSKRLLSTTFLTSKVTSWQNEIWQQTPSLIGLWKVTSIPKICIKYCDFVLRFYEKQCIAYHTLFKRLMCPVKKPQILPCHNVSACGNLHCEIITGIINKQQDKINNMELQMSKYCLTKKKLAMYSKLSWSPLHLLTCTSFVCKYWEQE